MKRVTNNNTNITINVSTQRANLGLIELESVEHSNSTQQRADAATCSSELSPTDTQLLSRDLSSIKLQKISTFEEAQNLINFINNSLNKHLLNRLEVIQFDAITIHNAAKVEELLNLLAAKAGQLSKLHSIIFPTLAPSISSYFFGTISRDVTLALSSLPALSSLSFGDIDSPLNLSNCQKLKSFSCGDMRVTPIFPDSVGSLVCKNIYGGDNNFSKYRNLKEFSCSGIYNRATISLPDGLESFSCTVLIDPIDLSNCLNLKQLSFKKTMKHIPPPQNHLPHLKYLPFEKVKDSEAKQIFKALQAKINERNQTTTDNSDAKTV